jgi:hypothetical protein
LQQAVEDTQTTTGGAGEALEQVGKLSDAGMLDPFTAAGPLIIGGLLAAKSVKRRLR